MEKIERKEDITDIDYAVMAGSLSLSIGEAAMFFVLALIFLR